MYKRSHYYATGFVGCADRYVRSARKVRSNQSDAVRVHNGQGNLCNGKSDALAAPLVCNSRQSNELRRNEDREIEKNEDAFEQLFQRTDTCPSMGRRAISRRRWLRRFLATIER